MKRVLLVGGGSAGHLAPLVAIAESLEKHHPGIELHTICSNNETDALFLRVSGLACTPIVQPVRSIMLPIHLLYAGMQARTFLRSWKPDIVVSKGGAVSVPVCKAASRMGIPIVLHESDTVMGTANMMVAPLAHTVCVGWKETMEDPRLSKLAARSSQLVFTGNPIREAVTKGSAKEGLRLCGFTGEKPVLLVIGGSQGALAINEVLRSSLPQLLPYCDICHLTGRGKDVIPVQPGYYPLPFAFDILPHLYAMSSLAISRSGAGAIAELSSCKIPMILIPIRGLANDHQYRNAMAAKASGGCLVIDQETMNEQLSSTVQNLLRNEALRQEMRLKVHTLSHPDSASQLSTLVLQCIEQQRKHL